MLTCSTLSFEFNGSDFTDINEVQVSRKQIKIKFPSSNVTQQYGFHSLHQFQTQCFVFRLLSTTATFKDIIQRTKNLVSDGWNMIQQLSALCSKNVSLIMPMSSFIHAYLWCMLTISTNNQLIKLQWSMQCPSTNVKTCHH
jgi:hypothetical protein